MEDSSGILRLIWGIHMRYSWDLRTTNIQWCNEITTGYKSGIDSEITIETLMEYSWYSIINGNVYWDTNANVYWDINWIMEYSWEYDVKFLDSILEVHYNKLTGSPHGRFCMHLYTFWGFPYMGGTPKICGL